MLRDRYYSATHRDGVLCVRDRSVLRRVTECLLEDAKVRDKFVLLPGADNFHKDDVDKVFGAYLHRVETMMGNEYAHQLMEGLQLRKEEKLGALRILKRDRDEQVKGIGVGDEEGESSCVQTNSKRKRRRRKKKNW